MGIFNFKMETFLANLATEFGAVVALLCAVIAGLLKILSVLWQKIEDLTKKIEDLGAEFLKAIQNNTRVITKIVSKYDNSDDNETNPKG